MDKNEEIIKKIKKLRNTFSEITGLPTSFEVETNGESLIFDDEKKEFVKKKPSSQWMADNPKRWMADSPSLEPAGTKRLAIGVVTAPGNIETYSQKFDSGELVREEKDTFIDVNSERVITEKEQKKGSKKAKKRLRAKHRRNEKISRETSEKEKVENDKKREKIEDSQQETFTAHQQIPSK